MSSTEVSLCRSVTLPVLRSTASFAVAVTASCVAAAPAASASTFPSAWCVDAAVLSASLVLLFRSAAQAAAREVRTSASSAAVVHQDCLKRKPSKRSPTGLPAPMGHGGSDRIQISFTNLPRFPSTAHANVSVNTVSVSQRRNDSLSLNCLNNSVSSLSTPSMTRASALSCSIRAFCRSECALAFW